MCELSGKLVAWLDSELPESEGAELARHVKTCEQCAFDVRRYQEVSGRLRLYCDAVLESAPAREPLPWVPVLTGIAAAAAVLALILLWPRTAEQPLPRVAPLLPGPVVETAQRVAPAHVARRIHRHVARVVEKPPAPATMPAFQIVIPADALLPPGAAPAGVSFVADVTLASDGSLARMYVRP